jgi:hypothetical protein
MVESPLLFDALPTLAAALEVSLAEEGEPRASSESSRCASSRLVRLRAGGLHELLPLRAA